MNLCNGALQLFWLRQLVQERQKTVQFMAVLRMVQITRELRLFPSVLTTDLEQAVSSLGPSPPLSPFR